MLISNWLIEVPVPPEKPVTVPAVTLAVQEKPEPGTLAVNGILVVVPEQMVSESGFVVNTGKGLTTTL